MSNYEIAKIVVDQCSTQELMNPELVSITKAEQISGCLNRELGAYGVKSHVTPDKTSIFIDDQGMSKVLNFFEGKSAQPVVTAEQVERVQDLIKSANENHVSLLWSQAGLKKKYYYLKQYGFNGVNLFNVLKLNTINAAGVVLSPTASVAVTMSGAMALSWTGSMFLSTLDNYVPNTMPITKTVIKGSRFAISIPMQIAEYTSNLIIGSIENVTIGAQLPTNVTSKFQLTDGPKLQDISKLKKPIKRFLLYISDKYLS